MNADTSMITSLRLSRQTVKYLDRLSKITTSTPEAIRMSLYLANNGFITPKKVDGVYERRMTLKLCKSLLPQKKHSEYANGCMNSLETSIDLESNIKKEMVQTARDFSTCILNNCYELVYKYDISFSELVRYSLFMHYYLNTPLIYTNPIPYETKSLLIPSIIYERIDNEHTKKNCAVSYIIQGSLNCLLQKEFGERKEIEFFPSKVERLAKIAKCEKYLDEINAAYNKVAKKTIIGRGAAAAVIYYTIPIKDCKILRILAQEEKVRPNTIISKANKCRKIIEEA
jgi:hypothetical protein